MSDRTLVKMTAGEYCIGFRTVSQSGKSPREFLVTRDGLERLETECCYISQDIHCFAVFRRDIDAGSVSIEFTWLHDAGYHRVSGYEETVRIPYDSLMAFVRGSAKEDGPKQRSVLSVVDTRRPKLVFCDREGLHRCVENIQVRKKLSRFLRDHFNWPSAKEVRFYRDSIPYSFFFREMQNGCPGIVGGVILHGQENMKKAYYGIHT